MKLSNNLVGAMERQIKKGYTINAIIFLIALMSFKNLPAQSYFKDFLKDQGLSFSRPKGYRLKIVDDGKNDFEFNCITNGRKYNILPDFFLESKDKSVLILIEDNSYDSGLDILNPYWYDDNSMFYNNALHYADTLNNPLQFYSTQELNIINADGATAFSRKCSRSNNAYISNRCIYITKFYQGEIQLTYLFKDTSRLFQDKVINETSRMFKYSTEKQRYPPINYILDQHHILIDSNFLKDTLSTRWNRGKIYNNLFYFNREQFAIRKDSIIISIQLPVNTKWPYFNRLRIDDSSFFYKKEGESWSLANTDFEKYLRLSNTHLIELNQVLLEKVNADKGYVFGFTHIDNDFYRNLYAKCRVVLLHKDNVGSLLIKYYYPEYKTDEYVDSLIQRNWQNIKFKNDVFFKNHLYEIYPF